jgi:hypothetical protein
MTMGTSEIFLIALTIILAVPWLAWRLLDRDDHAPLVVVQIVGGILLGRVCSGRSIRPITLSCSIRR